MAQTWIERCLQQLPPRERVLHLDHAYISLNLSLRHGVIRLQYNTSKPDTIVCVNLFNQISDGRAICKYAHDLLSENGVIIIVCKIDDLINPGMLRYYLRPFAWKYITAVPAHGDIFSIAGKGEKYYDAAKA